MVTGFDFDIEKDTIFQSEFFPQARFHYSDIRALISNSGSIYQLKNLYFDLINNQNSVYLQKFIQAVIFEAKKIHIVYQYFNTVAAFENQQSINIL